jgi:hypothetical protein
MDNILMVVDDLEAVKGFFLGIGWELEGETMVSGPTVDRLFAHGAELVGEVVQSEDAYRLGPEGILVGLSEQLK